MCPRNANRLRMSAIEEAELLHKETESQGSLFLSVTKTVLPIPVVEGVLEV